MAWSTISKMARRQGPGGKPPLRDGAAGLWCRQKQSCWSMTSTPGLAQNRSAGSRSAAGAFTSALGAPERAWREQAL
jgi:hypothetical protein